MTIPKAMSTRQAAEYTGLSASTLNKLRLSGGGPQYLKLGARVAYELTSLDAWLAKHRRMSTSEYESIIQRAPDGTPTSPSIPHDNL